MKCPETGKICHNSERQAWISVIQANKSQTRLRGVYKCPYCKKWHTTSKKTTMPYWVKSMISKNDQWFLDQKRREEKKKKQKDYLTLAEQKEILKTINNKKTLWKSVRARLRSLKAKMVGIIR